MGRRKERRFAAMHGAGRRVKLDLFAEPSGDAGGSSSNDGVGRNMDDNHHAGDPVSPSSSGQKQENPLMLLGQYSDEELDEEATEQPNNADEQTSLTGLDFQAEHGDVNSNKGHINDKDVTEFVDKESDKLNTTESKEGNSVKEEIISSAAVQNDEADSATHAPEASGPQVLVDVTGGWKMVMDEQTNRYYYWNTFTGETSWETPSSLALASENISEHDVSLDEDKTKTLVHEHSSMQLNDAIVSYSNISSDNQSLNGGDAHLSYDPTNYTPLATGISYREASILPNVSSFHHSHIFSEHLTSLGEVVHASSGEQKDMHMTNYIESAEAAAAHSVTLIQYAESLLQRLNTLTRSGNYATDHALIMKEIEIRISDCKALSSYGSSLLPFWWHTEVQLKQLESVIAKEESSQLFTSENCNKQTGDKATVSSESLGTKSETVGKNEGTTALVLNDNSPSRYASKDGQPEMSNVSGSNAAETEQTLSGPTFQASRDEKEPGEIEAYQTILPADIDKVDSSAIEDVDMDVEMEVEEEIPADQTADAGRSMGEDPTLLEQQIQTSLSTTERAPPPPEEEWIPPPPPESEAIPPPPTEEPPTSPIPPPFPETRSLHSHQEQFNTGYTVPTYDYSTPTVNEVGNNGYYAPVEGCHIALQATPYYGPVAATAFPHLGDVGSVEPVVYYDPSNTVIPAGPAASSVDSSIYYLEAGSIGYHNHNSASMLDQSGKVTSTMGSGSSSLLPEKIDTNFSQPASFTSAIQVAESSLVNGNNADAPPATAIKNQSKVVRGKKRTLAVVSSLRSNKKVSSLVNKWKAAKEELHGDEDEDEEPENAYEVLERKRLKEIEEWRKRQIESGEAQDNANFLPLGSDWRERVRRKRVAKTKAAQTPSEAVEDEKRIPNLTELSKDLPSGWQAYWDESTKEVYYGNTVTSETSWTKPSR